MARRLRPVEVPPSFEWEAKALGGQLLYGVESDTPPEHYLHPGHRAIAEAMAELHGVGQPVDAVTVIDRMRGSGTLERLRSLGGDDYLTDLLAALPTIGRDNIRNFCTRVSEEATARELEHHAADALRARRAGEPIEQITARLLAASQHARTKLERRRRSKSLTTADLARTEWKRALPLPVSCGMPALDAAIGGGFRAESTYFLNGSTGKGKSGLALQWGRHLSAFHPVLVLTSELTPRQVLARLVAPLAGTSWRQLYEAPPNDAERIAKLIEECAPRLFVHKLRRDDDVVRLALDLAEQLGTAPILILDYLQHAARRMGGDNVGAMTALMSDQLTGYASDHRTTSIVVSSVARGFYNGHEERSATDYLGASKHSGDVEFDGAGVFFLETETCPIGGTAAARLHIAKSRFGGEGTTVGLRFRGASGSFEEDPKNSLPTDQRAAYELIDSGATSVEEVRVGLSIGKQAANKLIDILARKNLITRRPLAVVRRAP